MCAEDYLQVYQTPPKQYLCNNAILHFPYNASISFVIVFLPDINNIEGKISANKGVCLIDIPFLSNSQHFKLLNKDTRG